MVVSAVMITSDRLNVASTHQRLGSTDGIAGLALTTSGAVSCVKQLTHITSAAGALNWESYRRKYAPLAASSSV
jgi:hypothetical protein